MESARPKIYVIDTSVLMRNPHALDQLCSGNTVVIPHEVPRELDLHKESANGTGMNARAAINRLIEYSDLDKTRVTAGIAMPGGGTLVFDDGASGKEAHADEWQGFRSQVNDDLVIRLARRYRREHPDSLVTLVTQDGSMLLKARPLGVNVERLQALPVTSSVVDELYSGQVTLDLSPEWFKSVASSLHRGKVPAADVLKHVPDAPELVPNQCCTLRDPDSGKSVFALYKKIGACPAMFRRVVFDEEADQAQVRPRTLEQAFAFALMTDPEIRFVTLAGPAGCGKTLMALLAALDQMNSRFEKIVVCRPIVEVGGGEGGSSSLGYLPGDLGEKLVHWHRPTLDNIEFIMRKGKDAGSMGAKFIDLEGQYAEAQDLIAEQKLAMYPISHMRGMSIHDALILCDEAQNTKIDEAKAIITRAAGRSMVVMAGDPDQSDLKKDPKLTGLVHAVEVWKGWDRYAHLTLTHESVLRSELAREAVRRM
jgi:PhoH-like ATPase